MITPEQLKAEIQRIFKHIERSTGIKRKRATQSIRDEAYQNIRKKRLEVTHEFDLQFLQKNSESDQLRGIMASHIIPPDLIEALTSASNVLNN